MLLPKATSIARRSRSCPLPDMAPLAGTAFCLLFFFFLASSIREPSKGIVSLEELPHENGIFCAHDAPMMYIGLSAKGHFSFSTSAFHLQAVVLKQVSSRHGIFLSDAQVITLQKLPSLATTVEQLPTTLSDSTSTTVNLSAIQPLDEAQLADCVKTARVIAPSLIGSPVYCSLLIHAETPASKVMNLLQLLQVQGINRFNLQTQQ